MGPFALSAYERSSPKVRRLLLGAQHFLITDALVDACAQAVDERNTVIEKKARNEEEWPVFSGVMPSPRVVLESESLRALFIDEGKHIVGWTLDDLNESFVRFEKGGRSWACKENSAEFCDLFDALLGMLCEPRLIEKTPPPRPMRKRAARALGATPLPAWHRISWTVGESARARGDQPEGSWRAPLHFSRAHWRRAKPEHPSSVQRADAPGWWTFVKHSWKGHPDFGIKLAHYTPRLQAGDRIYRGGENIEISSRLIYRNGENIEISSRLIYRGGENIEISSRLLSEATAGAAAAAKAAWSAQGR